MILILTLEFLAPFLLFWYYLLLRKFFLALGVDIALTVISTAFGFFIFKFTQLIRPSIYDIGGSFALFFDYYNVQYLYLLPVCLLMLVVLYHMKRKRIWYLDRFKFVLMET